MSRKRRYLETSVLEEARKRIEHLYDIFDTLVVMFSGGKDSLVTLHLVREVAERLGALPVPVVFRDEELIPDSVIATVDHYRQADWLRMLWFAVPLHSEWFVLGETRDYIQWDPAREHVRAIPPWAITEIPGEPAGKVFSQYDMDQAMSRYFKGKIAAVTGIRASESLVRYRASVNKLNENYITASDSLTKGAKDGYRARAPNVMLAKPIYDWEEEDVMQYIFEHGLRYAPTYNAQHLAGVKLRVATPMHADAATRMFFRLREIEPELYASVIAIWPDMILQERYWKELDTDRVKAEYGQSLAGVRQWVNDHLSGGQRDLALRRLDTIVAMAIHQPESWPPDYVLRQFMGGHYKRLPQPYRTRGIWVAKKAQAVA